MQPQPHPGYDSKQKGGTERKPDKVEGEHIVKNPAPITKFLMKEGKIWKHDFSGKCTRDHPKWDETTFMCACWHIRAECFVDCKNKASHMGACAVPHAKHAGFKAYLNKVC
jgi:hypothetical protein